MRAPLTGHRYATICSKYRMTLPTCEPSTALRATKPPLRIPQGRSPAGSHTRSNLLCRLKVEAGKTRGQTASFHCWVFKRPKVLPPDMLFQFNELYRPPRSPRGDSSSFQWPYVQYGHFVKPLTIGSYGNPIWDTGLVHRVLNPYHTALSFNPNHFIYKREIRL